MMHEVIEPVHCLMSHSVPNAAKLTSYDSVSWLSSGVTVISESMNTPELVMDPCDRAHLWRERGCWLQKDLDTSSYDRGMWHVCVDQTGQGWPVSLSHDPLEKQVCGKANSFRRNQ